VITWLAVVALIGSASAPQGAPPTPPSPVASPSPVPSPSASPRPADAFAIQAEAGEATLRVTGYLHADGRLFPDQPDLSHSFLLRRARPIIQVSFRRRFDLVLTPDFGGGSAVIQDAYVDVRYAQSARLRAGKGKAPFGLERLQSATVLLFPERGFPSGLGPNRDVGLQLFGDRGPVTYAVGVFNGVVDGGSGDGDTDDSKDVAARLFVVPGRKADGTGGAGLGFGVAATYGTASGALPTFRSGGQQAFATYRTGAVADGTRFRISPQATIARGPVRALAEYVRSRQEVRASATAVPVEVTNQAWQVALGWTLTGESAAGWVNPSPKSRFEPGQGWGAFELAARAGTLRLDDALVSSGLVDPARSAREAFAWALGLNWYLDRHVKQSASFERTTFDGGTATGDRRAENAVILRIQLSY
jgi:phosphate-selective porin OprO/OprP